MVQAQFTDNIVRVYQAFSPNIADSAIHLQKFGDGFKMERMTWIKPSFCWMLYRSRFATAQNQERILAIDIKRTGLEWALTHSVLTSHNPENCSRASWKNLLATNPVRVQWDPERDICLEKIEGVRAIQIGLSGDAVVRYVNNWIVGIDDVTHLAGRARRQEAKNLLELGIHERPYPLPSWITKKIGGSNF